MEKKLEVVAIVKNGIGIGMTNLVPILVNVLLWILTCWIPYLNIGTTIGLAVGIVSKASKGEPIGMTEIFDPKYRKFMGEFFLTEGLVAVGAGIGCALFFIPGIVISIAWSFAPLLAVDKGKNPTESLTLSNNATYGNKGSMFLSYLALSVAASILCAIFAMIPVIGFLLVLAVVVLSMFTSIGIYAYCYKELCANV